MFFEFSVQIFVASQFKVLLSKTSVGYELLSFASPKESNQRKSDPSYPLSPALYKP